MILDAHQHFWRYAPSEYPWMSGKMGALRRDFLPADLQPLAAATQVVGTVAVQARQTLGETAWLLELADASALIHGVVGWIDLSAGDARAQLERFSGHPKFRGARHVLHDEPDDRFMRRPAFRHGIAALAEFDLTYDLLLFPRHLPVAVELVAEFPEQRFVVDHLAKPRIALRELSPWREHLREIAQYPNVCCKVSGFATETDWAAWRSEEFQPYFDAAYECFGADRLMLGTDWPVCTLSATYADAVGVVADWARCLSEEERAAILCGTATNFYRLTRRSAGVARPSSVS